MSAFLLLFFFVFFFLFSFSGAISPENDELALRCLVQGSERVALAQFRQRTVLTLALSCLVQGSERVALVLFHQHTADGDSR